jgi:hypothetical protein
MMVNLIAMYINNMSVEDFNRMALEQGINLSNDELEFSYNFIKDNWLDVFNDYDSFDFSKYKKKYSDENYEKIRALIDDMYSKYGHLVK